MTQQEFEQHRQTWIKEWNDKWRLLDIDFEAYMLMKGMSPDEYKAINEESWNKNELIDDEWGETFMTLINNKIHVYTNNEFDVESVDLVYYRKPINIQIEGCVDPYTELVSLTNVECEFKDDVTEVLIDECVKIISGDIESFNQVSINTESVEQNN